MHKLLQRQLRQAQQTSSDGTLDLDTLLSLVGTAYDEIDRERRFTAHAHKVLRDEYAALTERQLKVEAEKSEAERARHGGGRALSARAALAARTSNSFGCA